MFQVTIAATIAAAEVGYLSGHASGYEFTYGYGWTGPQGFASDPLGLRAKGAVTPNDVAAALHFTPNRGHSLGSLSYATGPAITATTDSFAAGQPAITGPAVGSRLSEPFSRSGH